MQAAELTQQGAQIVHIFESGHKGAGQVIKGWQINQATPTTKQSMKSLAFRLESKRTHIPLQAADVVAYEIWQECERHYRNPSEPSRWQLGELQRVRHNWSHPSADEVRKYMKLMANATLLNPDLSVRRAKRLEAFARQVPGPPGREAQR